MSKAKPQANFRLHTDTIKQIQTIAEYEKVSHAKIIEIAINYFLDQNYPGEVIGEDGTKFIFARRKLI
jgi:hypothetical protein